MITLNEYLVNKSSELSAKTAYKVKWFDHTALVITYDDFKKYKKEFMQTIYYNLATKQNSDLYNLCNMDYELNRNRGEYGAFVIYKDPPTYQEVWKPTISEIINFKYTEVKDIIVNITWNEIAKILKIR